MQRVIVVGPSGSGKTTVATTVARHTGMPHTELDALWWDAGWTEVGAAEFACRLAPVIATDRWVLCGNYFSVGTRELAWPRADTIVFLDFSRWRTIVRIVLRTVRRSVRRTELWAGTGNRETLRTILRRDELLRFAWDAYPKYRARYSGIRDDPELAHLTVIRLGSPRAVRAWIGEVTAAARTHPG